MFKFNQMTEIVQYADKDNVTNQHTCKLFTTLIIMNKKITYKSFKTSWQHITNVVHS